MENKKYMWVISHYEFVKYNPLCPEKVPMDMLNEEMAQINHSQSLDKLNRRGGMSPYEMVLNIEKNKSFSWSYKVDNKEYTDRLVYYYNKYNKDNKNN